MWPRLGQSAGQCAAALVMAGWVAAVAALGQSASTLEELNKWHERVANPKTPASVEDGRAALALVKQWTLSVDQLAPEPRAQLLRLQVYAALSVGDAAQADKHLAVLQHEFPDTRETLQAAWITALAAGDAQQATRVLEKLEAKGLAGKGAERQREYLQRVGQFVPDVTVTTNRGRSVSLRQRDGVVLVLDFWNTRQPPSDKQAAALRALYAAFASEMKVQFLGVNADEADAVDAAKKWAAEHDYTWPQHFEQRGAGAPLSDAAFQVSGPPWQAIVDGRGGLRMVGTAQDPALLYVVRAAVAEAKGEVPPLAPRTSDGQQPCAPVAPPKPEPAKGRAAAAKAELPHNADAARLLDQARLYLKTGKKAEAQRLLQEIIDKYPDTWEGREARHLQI